MQRQQAETAAERIGQFIKEIESQMGWLTQTTMERHTLQDWQFDSVRLLRQVPAITELARIDATGHEQARVSRIAVDVIGGKSDFSHDRQVRPSDGEQALLWTDLFPAANPNPT